MAEPYGDGHELDRFDDLEASPEAEAKFIKEPRTKFRLKRRRISNGKELDKFKDLPVSPAAEARYLKPPVLVDMPTFGNTGIKIRRRDEVFQPCSTGLSSTVKVPERKPDVIALPRELRDEVYRHLLCNTYVVNLPPVSSDAVFRGYCTNEEFEIAFPLPLHSHFQPPQPCTFAPDCGYTVAPWCPGTPCYDIHRRNEQDNKEREDNARFQRQFKFAVTWKCLPILLASTATSEEAATVLYDTSTFFFSIDQPRQLNLESRTVERMKSIYLHIDLLKAYLRKYSTKDQARTLEFCRRILAKFGGDKNKRTTCIINFDRGEETTFLRLRKLIHALKGLVGFNTVVIKVTPAYTGWLNEDVFPKQIYTRQLRDWREYDLANLSSLDANLKVTLGPGKPYGRKDFCCLIYHPRSHMTGSPSPEYDVNDLAEPEEPAPRASTSARYFSP